MVIRQAVENSERIVDWILASRSKSILSNSHVSTLEEEERSKGTNAAVDSSKMIILDSLNSLATLASASHHITSEHDSRPSERQQLSRPRREISPTTRDECTQLQTHPLPLFPIVLVDGTSDRVGGEEVDACESIETFRVGVEVEGI